ERARHVALPKSGQARQLLHAAVRSLPLFLDDVHRRLDGETPFAALDRLDRDLHRHSGVAREGRVFKTFGVYHAPVRTPWPPPGQQRSGIPRIASGGSSGYGEVWTRASNRRITRAPTTQ